MSRRLALSAIAFLSLATIMPGRLEASPIEISGSGTYTATAPTSSISRANATYAFSFMVNDVLGTSNTIGVTNASYQLDGVTVTPTFTSVTFYPAGNSGLFDLNFTSGSSASFYGPQVYDDSTRALIRGTYVSSVGQNSGATNGAGTVTVGSNATAVPEPTTIAMAGVGLVCAGLVARRRVKG